MVNVMNGNFLTTARKCGEYSANFLLGTGANTMGQEIAQTIKNRKALNVSIPKAFTRGLSDGFVKSNAEVVEAGGYFKNLRKVFSSLPKNMKDGWINSGAENKGLFKRIGAWLKPLGKTMPFAMNALWLASSIPDIIGRTKEDGLWGGIKETGKALVKMAAISLTASVAAPFGIAAMLIAPSVTGIVTNAIFGKSYSEKKAEQEEAQQLAQQQAGNNAPQVGQRLDISK